MVADTVTQLARGGIPSCVHMGLTPQSVNVFGGYKVQGKTPDAAAQLIADAKVLEQAGAAYYY
jgi:3-methyl-2-oxobutanoate hydroxymethyltransferase